MNRITHIYKQLRGIVFFSYINIRRRLRVLLGKKVFYVIGDSHTLCFQHEYFMIYHVGPATAYKLNFNKSTTRGREKVLKILNNIYKDKPINVIFVFGELDTRLQINKISNEKGITTENVIKKTIDSYMAFLRFVKQKYPLIDIYVFNILPQGEEKNIYNFPFYADRRKRSVFAKEMNKNLKEKVKENKFKFIYIYDNLIDKKEQRIKIFVFDDVHFNRKIIPFVVKVLDNLTKESQE